VSRTGRPECECRSAQHEGRPVCGRSGWRWPLILWTAVWLAGCATPRPVEPVEEIETGVVAEPPHAPLVEYPPIEPVEMPPLPATEIVAPRVAPAEPSAAPGPRPSPAPAPAPPAPEVPTDEQVMVLLVADLQRYNGLGPDDVRKELLVVTQALGRQRTDANRVRLAVLYTLVRTPQDDQRALQLFDNVAKSNPGSPAVKQLAAVLQVQVSERARAVRDERQKADAAIQKLEALREMERALLRDRIRSGGGDGGGGGSGGGSGR
jgi:hypothetical protein